MMMLRAVLVSAAIGRASAFVLATPHAPRARLAASDTAMSASSRTLVRNVANVAAALAFALATPGAALAKGGGHGSSHSSSHSSGHSSSHVSRSVSRSSVPRSYSPRTTSSGSRRSSSSRSSRSSSSGKTYSSGSSTYYRSPPSPPRRSTTRSTPPRPSTPRRSTPPRRSTTIYTDPTTIYTEPIYSEPVYTSPSTVVVTPRSATDEAFHNGLWAGRAEAVAFAAGAYYTYQQFRDEDDEDDEDRNYGRELEETRELMQSLAFEFEQTDPLVSSIQAPDSGRYIGDSAEDDDGDQAVMTHLRFEKDGKINGWGQDGVDGGYVITEGRWCSPADGTGGARVAWIETYDDGFEVALRGQVRKSDGAIVGMWASTRGVSGSVKLELA